MPPWQPGAGLPRSVALPMLTDRRSETGLGQQRRAPLQGLPTSLPCIPGPARQPPPRFPSKPLPMRALRPHLRSQRSAFPLPNLRIRPLPFPSRTMSPRMLYAAARAPPCPSPTLVSVSTLLPGIALFPTIGHIPGRLFLRFPPLTQVWGSRRRAQASGATDGSAFFPTAHAPHHLWLKSLRAFQGISTVLHQSPPSVIPGLHGNRLRRLGEVQFLHTHLDRRKE